MSVKETIIEKARSVGPLDVISRSFVGMSITPSMAVELLELNYAKQRKLSNGNLAQFTRDMKNGKWNEMACAPIKMTHDGVLLDGQHRLQAVVDSGKTIIFVFDVGGDETQFEYLDNGKPRTASSFIDKPQGSNVSALANIILCWEAGSTLVQSINGQYPGTYRGSVTKPGRIEKTSYVDENYDKMISYVRAASRVHDFIGGGSIATIAASLLFFDHAVNRQGSFYLVDVIVSGAAESVTLNTMARTLIFAFANHGQATKEFLAGAILMTFDAEMDGRTLKILKSPHQWLLKHQGEYMRKHDAETLL